MPSAVASNEEENAMSLRKRALGLSLGVVWGVAVLIVTLWALLQGRGTTVGLLFHYYPGYSVSYPGAFAGLFWGFINGFIGGVLIAWFYDLFCKILYKSEA
jgi:hypothetical protein